MSLGQVFSLLVIAWLGYLIVSYFLNHFPGRKDPVRKAGPARRATPAPEAEVRPANDGQDIARTWYRTLDVAPTATLDEISLAYRRKITQYHPDKVASLGPELRELAESKSKALNEAYAYAKKGR